MNRQRNRENNSKQNKTCTLESPISISISKDLARMFDIERQKKENIVKHVCESIKKNKMKFKATGELPYALPSRPATAKDFLKFSENCPTVEMSRHMERNIKQKVGARGLEEKYPQLLADILHETKLEYNKVVHYVGLNKKIKQCYPEAVYIIEPYKYVGKTERYQHYLKTRKRFNSIWILHYPIIRKIHKECVLRLPYELIEFKFHNLLEISDIEYILKDKWQAATQYIYEFHKKIQSTINKQKTKDKRFKNSRYLEASTCILSVHVSRSIAHTLLHVVKKTSSEETRPYLILNISFKEGLCLEPKAEKVISIFNSFLDKLIDVGQEVHKLKHTDSNERIPINLCLTDEFVTKCKEDIEQNIFKMYQPVHKYLENLNDKFKSIYKNIDSNDFLETISDIVFEEGCKKIIYFQDYVDKVMFIPDHEFFKIGKLYLINYREHIHDELNKNITLIFQKLCSQHLWEVEDIRDTFEMIKMKATQKTITTEELVESGKYMTWIKNEYLEVLNSRVLNSLSSLCQIIDLGELYDEHMQLNSTIIHWLEDVVPIIDEHTINFEQLKFDAEDKLQKVVEDVNILIKDMIPLLVILDEMDDIAKVRNYLSRINLHMMKIKDIEAQISWINKEEVCLSFPKSSYSEYEDLKNYVYPFYHLLNLCLEVQRNISVWKDGPFEALNFDSTNASVERFHTELTNIYKIYRKKLRQAQDENLPLKFKGTVDDPDILNWPAPLKLCGTALKLIEEFKPSVSVMKIICNPALRKRHWTAISQIAGVNVTPNAGTTLQKMMMVDFKSNFIEYEIISTGATKEKQLFTDLEQLKKNWNDVKFLLTTNSDFKLSLLSNLQDIEIITNDDAIKLLKMQSSVFVKPHKDKVSEFYNNIQKVAATIDCWSQVQNQLLKLLPVFSKSNLSEVMSKESELFNKILGCYNSYLDIIMEKMFVFKIVTSTSIEKDIKTCVDELEIVYCGVTRYLEVLRIYFPRFYFLSNEELFDIVSNTNYVAESQTFLIKIFQGMHSLHLKSESILGAFSKQSDEMGFDNALQINNVPLEILCSQIENEMRSSLKTQLRECHRLFRKADIKSLLCHFSAQVILIASQMYWQEDIINALKLKHIIKLRMCYQTLNNSINDKINIINDGTTTNLERLKIRCIIINDINNKTLLNNIIEKKHIGETQFDWEACVKYYYKDQICTVQMLYAKISYQYEYLGNLQPLVSIPLTDRCFRTLINAYYLQLSGLLRGTSGVGKSAMIRSLASAFGIYCLTFNCPQQTGKLTLERILKGNALCGSWLSLENFSVLDKSVLSVLSEIMLSISSAIRSGAGKCIISNNEIRVNPTCFVCASSTFNNINTDLPENLKAQFRTITVVKPDYSKIAETILYSYGFRQASEMSKKLLCFSNLAVDVFSERRHYIFDNNSLTKVLQQCEKRKNITEDIDCLLYHSIRKIYAPQMIHNDFELLDNILATIFPNITYEEQNITYFRDNVRQLCQKTGLLPNDLLINKVIETYECIKENISIIVMGDTYSAKTTTLKLCKGLFEKYNNQVVELQFVNPNCYDKGILYGNIEETTSRWTDGIITKICRKYLFDDNKRSWLVFDGSLDDTWIENLHPLIKETKNLYLQSGECLILPDLYSTIFEVADLRHSPPSIISRCSMIYFEKTNIGWITLIESWINSCSSDWISGHQKQIKDILIWILSPSSDFITKNCHQLITLCFQDLVKNTLSLIEMTLDEVFSTGFNKEEEIKNVPSWIHATLMQCCFQGLCSTMDISSKHKYDSFYKELWRGNNLENPYPESLEKLEVAIPHDGLICDYHFIYKQRGSWKLYQDILKKEKILESSYMSEFCVPTTETLKYNRLLHMLIKNNKRHLLIGATGTGKSFLIEDNFNNRVNNEKYEKWILSMNINIRPNQMQSVILSKLNKRKPGLFSPDAYKNMLIFIDNLNLSTNNKYGTSSCLELFRQYMDHEIWYDYKNCEEIRLQNVNFITAFGLNNDNHNKISQRFLRHFHIFSLNELSDDTITRIYSSCLLHTWRKAGFPSDINTIVNKIVEGTLNIYKEVIQYCKPTLRKCFYTFNLCSFSKVIQVCSLLKKDTFDSSKKVYMRLWIHEVLRVFGDRLVSLERTWLQGKVKIEVQNIFNESIDEILDCNQDNDPMKMLMFGPINNSQPRKYEEILDNKHLHDILVDNLNKYNYYSDIKMDIIFFNHAIEIIIQICRILSIPFGNALLLGRSGSGRRSLTKLASFLFNFKLFQPIISQKYNIEDWNNDIKLILKESGALNNECVLLVNEEHLMRENFLHNIHYILESNEIPGFHSAEERQEILEITRLDAQGGNKNIDISTSSVFLYFNKRCRDNLHLVLCMNPFDNSLRHRLRKYPSLLKCHIIFCEDWPDESLQIISATWLENLNLKNELKDKIINACVYFHREFQIHTAVTSTSFIHLVKLFVELYSKKQSEINQKKQRYLQGLSKLSFAANQIADMQKALAEYQPQLEDMTKKAVIMTEQIALETIEVEKASALVRQDEKTASEQAKVAQILKSECESELAQAIPILEDAISALNTLKPSDITLVKSMKNPPDAIKLVMAAVCVIKDVKPERIPDPSTGRKTIDYWGPSKRILGDMNFLQTLKDFDKDHIKPEIMVKIRKEYLPHKDFKPLVVAKASSAAEGLCKWIIAMDMYDKVAKEVAPKKVKLEKAEKEYGETLEILNQKKEEVTRIEQRLADLNALLEDATVKQIKLQQEVDYCNKKLISAQKLIGSLSGEKIRWTVSVTKLEYQENLVPGNILLSCGTISYLGSLCSNERNKIISKWHHDITANDLLCSDNFSIIKSLVTEKDTDVWIENTLTCDNFFVENLIILNFSKLYSLLIDPEYQALQWIKKIEKYNRLTVKTFFHDDFFDTLIDCITHGKPILIHRIEEHIPPCIGELISKNIFYKNNEAFIKITNKIIKYNTNFRLYLVSNLRYPHITTEILNRIILINFSITTEALHTNLMKIVTEVEKPELRKIREELCDKKKKNMFELSELEDKILRTLCESQADILEDESSIKILDQSKDLAKIVREKQQDTKRIEKNIESFEGNYTSIPEYATNLYFCLVKLQNLNYIYQFSLDWYIDLYFKSIMIAEKSKYYERKCVNITKCLTYEFYRNVIYSLFEKDRITFLFLMTTSIILFKKYITEQQLMFFLGRDTADESIPVVNHNPDWIDDKEWKQLQKLKLVGLEHIMVSITNDPTAWQRYINSNIDYITTSPPLLVSNFHKLILVKILKPHLLLHNIRIFINEELGGKFEQNLQYNISNIFNESYNLSPILMFSCPGSNSFGSIRYLASQKNLLHRFHNLTFGDQDIKHALFLIQQAQEEGSWLLLQNCHLVSDRLHLLEGILTNTDFNNTHENFRLWLTSELTEGIPIELLQKCIVVIDDAPEGIKANLEKIYKDIPISDPDFYSSCAGKHEIFTKLMYGLVNFHCILQERNKFGRIGWNTPYFFDRSDLHLSLKQLAIIINEDCFSLGHLGKLFHMIGHGNYSSHMDNDWDIQLLTVLLKMFLNSKLLCNNYYFSNINPYGLPKKCDYRDFVNHISILPTQDNSELYGLNQCSASFINTKKSNDLIYQTLSIFYHKHDRMIEGNEFALITTIEDILEQIPNAVSPKVVNNYVILKEISIYNHLLRIIHNSLRGLRRAVSGRILISSDYENMAYYIINNRIPEHWRNKMYYFADNLPRFISNLIARLKFFGSVTDNDQSFWLQAFFLPKALICKYKLDFSKNIDTPFQNITFSYKMVEKETWVNSHGIYLRGLYIFGAKWDEINNTLCESATSIFNNYPVVQLEPRIVDTYNEANIYICPIYQNTLFDNYIHSVYIPCDDKDHWLKRGVRLVCQVDQDYENTTIDQI